MVAQGAARSVVKSHPSVRPGAGSAPPLPPAPSPRGLPAAFAEQREVAHRALADDSQRIVAAATDMADRFGRGGSLFAFGFGLAASDAQHLAVEFVHPVIVGKRALPAVALTGDVVGSAGPAATRAAADAIEQRLRRLASPADVAVGIASGTGSSPVLRGLETAAELGLLTVALVALGDDAIASSGAVLHALVAPADEPCLAKELHVSTYHLLWELVHVNLEQEPGPAALGDDASGTRR
jgi:D-sedoheptulose 7-phosphate isomerase